LYVAADYKQTGVNPAVAHLLAKPYVSLNRGVGGFTLFFHRFDLEHLFPASGLQCFACPTGDEEVKCQCCVFCWICIFGIETDNWL